MIIKLDLKDVRIAEYILKLQKASYSIEAEIIGYSDIPPLKDSVDTIKECEEIFYGYYIGEILAGIISCKIEDDVLDIHRVAVYPSFFRMGIAGKLLSYVENIFRDITKVKVCTGSKNYPAVNLYLKNGYQKIKDTEISKEVCVSEFEKSLI